MSLRDTIADLKTYPVTLAFCLAWIAVFIAMVAFDGSDGSPRPLQWSRLMIGMTDGHQFGDLTLRDLHRWEAWRLVTCTFVHYGIVHLGLNLFAMYQLGAIVENWYGSYQMILIYALTGGLGNLVSAAVRMMLGYERNVHSGGGSVVILGLVGLCAVVGWRSRTRRGAYLGQQMISVMVMTALLGIGFPLVVKGVGVDNWGHAGGAIVGALVALGHYRLVRNVGRPRACELGLLSLIVILGCGFAQLASERGEAKLRNENTLRSRVRALEQCHQILRGIVPLIATPKNAPTIISLLNRLEDELDVPATGAAYRRLKSLAAKAGKAPLSPEELAEFQGAASEVERVVRSDLTKAIDDFMSIRRSPSPAGSR